MLFPIQLYPFGSLEGDRRISSSGLHPRSAFTVSNYRYFFYDIFTTVFCVSY